MPRILIGNAAPPATPEEAADRAALSKARADMKALDWSTITDPKARKVLRDLWTIVRHLR